MVRATRWAWRWRRNPLRRRTDALEAWICVAAVALMLLAGTAVGWATGTLAHKALRETVREQQRHRHLVTATALRTLRSRPTGTDREAATEREGHLRVIARWPGPEGERLSGVVAVRDAADPGHRFRLWTDDQGRVAGRPMDRGTATVHAVLAGAGAGAGAAGLIEGCRRVVVWRLTRRRYADWDRSWRQAAHTWGRADAGS
ncbi:hypothetical protein M1P56_20385 [Streptomyces sp. HU2014]|uniref:Rv1733c family protein n=1 Tax=Streptomyces TaxID=1883 RepID=UPI001F344D21|nr:MULTISPECIES: hypothetical protein [Streptomyces]UQI46539.1 hypothetical protein M1P56_20385 [Streptomyces sp. HU2014]